MVSKRKSRLDKLLGILESSSHQETLDSAARHIAEVGLVHPQQLPAVCRKVHALLYSKKWEARVAAGQTLSLIAKKVPHHSCATLAAAANLPAAKIDELSARFPLDSLDRFDLDQILKRGTELLCSGGQEYDAASQVLTAEQLKKQRRAMKKQCLGLDGLGDDEDDLLADADLQQAPKRSLTDAGGRQNAKDLLQGLEGLSARERNKLKRQAKALERSNTASTSSDPQRGAPGASGRCQTAFPAAALLADSAQSLAEDDAEGDRIAAGQWPFSRIADQLCVDLLDSHWEVRHGAAVGLRELLASHAASAGVAVPKPVVPSGWYVVGGEGLMEVQHASEADVEAALEANHTWLEDVIILLMSLLVLDRFADYLDDQVMAPVRETSAQALAAAAAALPLEAKTSLLGHISGLQKSNLWEVRHGSMLSIKCILEACSADVGALVPPLLPVLVSALHDDDDDVRATAADACVPVCEIIAAQGADVVTQFTTLLWDLMPTLGELSPATASIMQLLARLYAPPDGADAASRHQLTGTPEALLRLQGHMARLWPYFRHPLLGVRRAVAACCARLLACLLKAPAVRIDVDPQALVQPVFRLAYQGLLVESDARLLQSCEELLLLLVQRCRGGELCDALSPAVLASLSRLPCVMIGERLPLDDVFFVPLPQAAFASAGPAESRRRAPARQKRQRAAASAPAAARHPMDMVMGEHGDGLVESARVRCANYLALVAFTAPTSAAAAALAELLAAQLLAPSALSQAFAGMVLLFWMLPLEQPDLQVPEALVGQLYAVLEYVPHAQFQELALFQAKMCAELKIVMTQAQAAGQALELPEGYTVESLYADGVLHVLNHVPAALLVDAESAVAAAHNRCSVTARRLQVLDGLLRCKVAAVLAAACAAWRGLPPKLNVLIQPLMAGVRRIPESVVQREVVAPGLSELVLICVHRSPCPNNKILKNVFTMACADAAVTPRVAPSDPDSDDETFHAERRLTGDFASTSGQAGDAEAILAATARKGAEDVLRCLTRRVGPYFAETLPHLWDLVIGTLAAHHARKEPPDPAAVDDAQALVNALHALQVVAPCLDATLHERFAAQLDMFVACLLHARRPVRHSAALAVVGLVQAAPGVHLGKVVTALVPLIEANASSVQRKAGVLLLQRLLEASDSLLMRMLPFVGLLVVPTLALMTDAQRSVRRSASWAFGRLVAVLPLAQDAPPPEGGLGPALERRQSADRAFLSQLLDAKQVQPFELAVQPAVTLRSYQHEGVSWLAFLKRSGLHGILADDMGLGKTLQSLCIVAAATHESLEARSADEQQRVLPSLIICPATLVGHWVAEVQRYFAGGPLRPLAYQGSAATRAALQDSADESNLLVASYESVRTDVAWFADQEFLYCVLDEGHIIRNPKAKVTQACKRILARHRLILSGTPIQNNVLELWNLFDFLMPGFMGEERAFTSKYSKLIAASKDANKGSREASAGLVALDALHKQVLPFILRRTKDQVLSDLPPKIMQDVLCDLTPLQARLYTDALASSSASGVRSLLSEGSSQGGARRGDAPSECALGCLQYLFKLCSHPRLVLDWGDEGHVAAAHAHLPPGAAASFDAALAELQQVEHSPKLVALRQLLQDCGVLEDCGQEERETDVGQHRVLVFAQRKATLDVIESVLLAPAGVSYLRLDGSVPAAQRFALVQQFNSDPTVGVMLLTTAVGGLGLNLTAADTVVFVEHDWNPMKDLQAMDRAHRLGQKRVVNVYRILMKDTLEERVMSLQQFKTDVADAVVNADNVSTATMDAASVLDIMAGAGDAGDGGADAKPPQAAGAELEGEAERPVSSRKRRNGRKAS